MILGSVIASPSPVPGATTAMLPFLRGTRLSGDSSLFDSKGTDQAIAVSTGGLSHIEAPLVNTGAPWPTTDEAEARVLVMQQKLHRWATTDPGPYFDDLFNLTYDPAFLVVAWSRGAG